MGLNDNLDTVIKVITIVILVGVALLVIFGWSSLYDFVRNPAAAFAKGTTGQGDDIAGYVKQFNDGLKQLFGG